MQGTVSQKAFRWVVFFFSVEQLISLILVLYGVQSQDFPCAAPEGASRSYTLPVHPQAFSPLI